MQCTSIRRLDIKNHYPAGSGMYGEFLSWVRGGVESQLGGIHKKTKSKMLASVYIRKEGKIGTNVPRATNAIKRKIF